MHISYDAYILTCGLDISCRDSRDEHVSASVVVDDVWIGSRAVVLPGIQIGSVAVVAARAVVTVM